MVVLSFGQVVCRSDEVMCTLWQGTADPPSHRVSAIQTLRYNFVAIFVSVFVSLFVYVIVFTNVLYLLIHCLTVTGFASF